MELTLFFYFFLTEVLVENIEKIEKEKEEEPISDYSPV
jgi:hypothetical protein